MEAIMTKAEQRSPVIIKSGGQKLFGILHRPDSDTKCPAVIIVHGFASHKIGTNRSWVLLAEALRESGVAVLRFDQRGFGDSEGDFSELAIEDMVDDIEAALGYMQNLEGIDKERIALFGSSLGGALSVLAATKTKSICALALWAPVASGPLWVADWFKANPALATAADPSKALSSYRGVSLSSRFQEQFRQLSAVDALMELSDLPLLHMHGEDDDVVSMQHQKAYRLARKNARADSLFVTYPKTKHFLGYEAIFAQALTTYVEWFTKTLSA